MLFFSYSLGFVNLGHTQSQRQPQIWKTSLSWSQRFEAALFSVTEGDRLCLIRNFSAFICHLFPVQRRQRIFFHGKAKSSQGSRELLAQLSRVVQQNWKPRDYYWKTGIKIWEHLLWFALVVPSMYYIKYRNKRNCKEISTAQDFDGIKSQMKFMIPNPFDVFIPLSFHFLYIILYVRYSSPKIHIYSFTG